MLKATASLVTMILLAAGAFAATVFLLPRGFPAHFLAGLGAVVTFFLVYMAIAQNVTDETPPEEFRRFITQVILVFAAPVPMLYGLFLLLRPQGVFHLLYLIFSFLVVAGFIGTVVRAEPEGGDEGRGAIAISEEEALGNSRKELVPDNPAFPWGGIQISRAYTTSNFLYIGVAGSGKSLSMRGLTRRLLRTVKTEPDTRALIYDEKPDALPYLVTMGFEAQTPDCRVLNPYDKRTWVWDLARECTSPTKARQIANLLCPLRKGQREAFFTQGAQGILTGGAMQL